ncbi:MAG: CDP-glycerol glycerophosphotransferase family protein [Planctomycetia bacterium]|nr:CDP-glycerol glycerophosphotransferase family protein [Planctomycetia bacterium]
MRQRFCVIQSWRQNRYYHQRIFQEWYPAKEKKIREKMRQKQPVRVGFFVSEPSKWSCDSLYKALSQHDAFEAVVCVFPQVQRGLPLKKNYSSKDFSAGSVKIENHLSFAESYEENIRFYTERGCSVLRGFDIGHRRYESLSFFRDLDIVFLEQPWAIVPPEIFVLPLSRQSLVCYIPYGFMSAAGIENYQYNLDLHNFSWRNFVETDWHKEQYIKYGKRNGENVVALGYPKLDAYAYPTEKPADKIWKSGLNPNVRRVVWAPHWSVAEDMLVLFSLFKGTYREILSYARRTPQVDWLFKPHPLLYQEIIHRGIMSTEETDAYYHEWAQLPNGQVCFDGGYMDYFKTSDALITDSVSFLIEYLPTRKPILRLLSEKNLGLNDFTNRLVQSYYQAKDMEGIKEFLSQVVLPQSDTRYNERMEALSELLNLGSAGESILQYLVELFQSD